MRCGSSGPAAMTAHFPVVDGWYISRIGDVKKSSNGQDAILVADASFLCTCMDGHLDFWRCLTLFRGAHLVESAGSGCIGLTTFRVDTKCNLD